MVIKGVCIKIVQKFRVLVPLGEKNRGAQRKTIGQDNMILP